MLSMLGTLHICIIFILSWFVEISAQKPARFKKYRKLTEKSTRNRWKIKQQILENLEKNN